MPSYPRQRKDSHSYYRPGYAMKSSDDQARADPDPKKLSARSPNEDSTISMSSELTLDDFGGRSDALGG